MASKGIQSRKTTRKLTAILSADVVGYSRLMGDDEEATIETLTAYRKVLYSFIQHLLRLLRSVGWRRCSRYLAIALLLTWGGLAAGVAQAAAPELTKPVRIGALTTSWGPTPAVVGLRDGLVALGYRENRDFVIGTRFVSGDKSALPFAAKELVQGGVDIIFPIYTSAVVAVQRATRDVPVVFVVEGDPVRAGLVSSFARPGGNITGVTGENTVLAPKRLEVFKKMIPGLSKVLFVYDGGDVSSVAQAEAYREAGGRLGIELVEQAVRTRSQAEAALSTIRMGDVDGIISPLDPLFNIPGLVAEASAKKGMPTMFPDLFMIDHGGLASYAPSDYSLGRQAARIVDKIIRGVKPADIPVEVNNDIEFAVNLKTAKALGLKIPPEVLYQATRIVR